MSKDTDDKIKQLQDAYAQDVVHGEILCEYLEKRKEGDIVDRVDFLYKKGIRGEDYKKLLKTLQTAEGILRVSE